MMMMMMMMMMITTVHGYKCMQEERRLCGLYRTPLVRIMYVEKNSIIQVETTMGHSKTEMSFNMDYIMNRQAQEEKQKTKLSSYTQLHL
jgi:hypothetical protein